MGDPQYISSEEGVGLYTNIQPYTKLKLKRGAWAYNMLFYGTSAHGDDDDGISVVDRTDGILVAKELKHLTGILVAKELKHLTTDAVNRTKYQTQRKKRKSIKWVQWQSRNTS